jgi:excisionase family DNA binding protein
MKAKEFVQMGMNVKSLPANSNPVAKIIFPVPDEIPLTVRQAAVFLGVSPQTVYLWVERKQIPHLRVMGRNIRFLKSELEPFRSQFKYEVENGETKQA